ncbi:hypothetical protein L1987_83321 [Smallanthus sonchifolius]|uniref:Uncharacterized protein n=1 Tax=Smallanthus sonchifolius TaxID=185202 RepID=A0ACB8YCJ2_9ASTR|nr:hypothetical protein L1987_83321 [Smallanthus sonchifolius]
MTHQYRHQLRGSCLLILMLIVDTGILETCLHACFISQTEPKNVVEALDDDCWIEAMQEELAQFDKLHVWDLVDLPKGSRSIGTKWVFRCKRDDRGVVVRNKARLVVQGFNQQEGVDYTKVYAPVSRIEAIRLFLAYPSFKGFKVFQLDVKSAFQYGKVKEEVFVKQPPGFEDPMFPEKVFKLDKALYGLHQAPRAWYETLLVHLLANGFERGQIDSTFFIRKAGGDLLLVQIYVDDIIFGSTNVDLCKDFERLMKLKFEMSSMGELSFFLGLQVNQKEDGFYIHQTKYVADILKKFDMENSSAFNTPIPVNHKLDSDLKGKEVDCRLYRGMIGSLMYLTASRPDIMFAGIDLCPSNAKSKPQLQFQHVRQNLLQHPVVVLKSYGFSNKKKLLGLVKVHTDDNLADLFTKVFDRSRFEFFTQMIGHPLDLLGSLYLEWKVFLPRRKSVWGPLPNTVLGKRKVQDETTSSEDMCRELITKELEEQDLKIKTKLLSRGSLLEHDL